MKLKSNLMLRVAFDLILVLLLLMLTRWVFFIENSAQFTHSFRAYSLMFVGGLKYDIAALMYGNVLWLLLVLFPLKVKERKGVWSVQKWVFVILNSLLLLANLCDTVFYSYRQSRTTADIFREFGGDKIGGVILTEVINHWYLVLLFVAMVYMLWRFYVRPVSYSLLRAKKSKYYVSMVLMLALSAFGFVSGVRGSLPSRFQRPMSVNYAQRYAVSPRDAAVVLNTPFTIIRTIGHSTPEMPQFYSSESELQKVYSPLHPGAALAGPLSGKNIVVMLLESFSQEFSGLLNPQYGAGYTPNLDSIMAKSLRFEETFSNSGFSIDAMPAVFASTPRMDRSFVVSMHGQNQIEGLPALLSDLGYQTAFFHGADNESLGLQGFARHAGFKEYYGLTEYCADSETGGMKDFDGSWGIWDEEFLQFFCRKLSTFQQPFFAGIFTLSSHHPFVVPDRYKDDFKPTPELPVLQTIRYADMALGKFFSEAARQPWFDNTVFVISADHTFLHPSLHPEYNTDVGYGRIPIFIYDPSGKVVSPGVKPGMMQQIDIMPTLLALMGYEKPFFAFGRNVLDSAGNRPWALRWSNVLEIMMDNHVLIFNPDNWQPAAMFNYADDPLLQKNLVNSGLQLQESMDSMLRAVVQTYQTLEGENRVTIKTYNNER